MHEIQWMKGKCQLKFLNIQLDLKVSLIGRQNIFILSFKLLPEPWEDYRAKQYKVSINQEVQEEKKSISCSLHKLIWNFFSETQKIANIFLLTL